jgi:peptidoglycan/xylan/chitin deacetylase (PgdA/CDA1 family)
MNKLPGAFSSLVKLLSLKRLMKLSGHKTILPFYHTVSDTELVHIKHLYPVRKVTKFEKDLDILLKYYKPIGLEELSEFDYDLRNLPGNNFLLTFDDGLKEFKDVIAPILQKKGIPAICFLNSSFINNKELFYRHKVSVLIEHLNKLKQQGDISLEVLEWLSHQQLPSTEGFLSLKQIKYAERSKLDELASLSGVSFANYLDSVQPYLTWEEIKSLKEVGFYFGAHSLDHPPFQELTEAEQHRQLKESLDMIVTGLNLDYRLFSFPFSDKGVSKVFLEKFFCGSSPIADLTFGTAGLKQSELHQHLQRIPMEKSTQSATAILKDEYFRCIVRTILNRNKTLHRTTSRPPENITSLNKSSQSSA